MIDLDIESIRARVAAADESTAVADRALLLAHLDGLRELADQALGEVRDLGEVVRLRLLPECKPGPPVTPQQAAAAWRERNGKRNLTIAQWQMLAELAERNKNPQNEWRFPYSKRRTGLRLKELGLAMEHDMWQQGMFCVFSITEEGRARLRRRAAFDAKRAAL